MKKHRPMRGFGVLLFLCICCAAVMAVFAYDGKSGGMGGDKGEDTIVGWMIDKIAAGEVDLADESSVRQALAEAEKDLEISLTEENKERVVAFMQTLDSIEVGADDFMEQAGEMYHKYSTEFVEEANDAINDAVGSAVKDAVKSFFENLIPGKDE